GLMPIALKYSLVVPEQLHNREKPFSGLGRGKSFSQSYHQICHERIHTGEQP
ncbi:ZN544 protein, partial [Pardalotus punctatus]|nr:ZN544 protein [Pardalotus punctatus]